MSLNDVNINEMFSQMSEKLGWLQLGDVDSAISSLTKKQKYKSTKKEFTTKKTNSATDITSSEVKPKITKKRGVSKKSEDVRCIGDCNGDAVKVTSDHKKNVKRDLLGETRPKSLGKISDVGSDSQKGKHSLVDITTQKYFDSSDLTADNVSNKDINNNTSNDGHKDYDKLGRDKTSLGKAVFSKPLTPHYHYSDDSNNNSIRSQSDLSVFDDSASTTGICKKISFMSNDSTTERSLNNSDAVSNTSNSSDAIKKSPLTTQIYPVVTEIVKSSEIPNVAISIAKPSLPRSATPRKTQETYPLSSSIQRSHTDGYFSKEDGSSKDKGSQQQMPSLINNTLSYFSAEEFISDDDNDDDCIIDCDDDDIFQDCSSSPRQHLSYIKSEKESLNDSSGSARSPLAAFNERRCQTQLRRHKYFDDTDNSNVENKRWKPRELSILLLSSDSSDDDDEFQTFLTKMKTPACKKPATSPMSMEVFLVSDSELSSDGGDSDDKYSVSLYHRTRPISPDITPFRGSFNDNPLSSVCKEKQRRSDPHEKHRSDPHKKHQSDPHGKQCQSNPQEKQSNPHEKHQSEPHKKPQSNPHEKQIDKCVKPVKDTKPKAKTDKHGGDDVFRKPKLFDTAKTNTNTSTEFKSIMTELKVPVWGGKSTPVHNVLLNIPLGGKVPQTCPTLKYLHQPPPSRRRPTKEQREGDKYSSFLRSLSENTENLSYVNEEASRYAKDFKRYRRVLVKKLFAIFNETVFDNRFPADFPIVWNKRLLTTAGHCKLKVKPNPLCKTEMIRTAEVNLAIKVCDTAERVRDTLIHELCHAAVWSFNGSYEVHGKLWKSWARRASQRYPVLPAITRCHYYEITTKYIYKCVQCGYSLGRHTKSLDTTKKVCGCCYGRLVLVTTAAANPTSDSNKGNSERMPPRTPNKFALFVKEHYGTVKKSGSCTHKDVMNILSQKFKEAQIC